MKTIVPPLKKSARLEIVPLIDVIFFLLATFILVSLTMTQQPGVRVELPLSKTSEPHELAESVTVTISQQGGVFWDEAMVSFDRFLTELIRYQQTCKIDGVQARILLNADRGAPYGQVATILDEIRKAGISKVTIETKVRAS